MKTVLPFFSIRNGRAMKTKLSVCQSMLFTRMIAMLTKASHGENKLLYYFKSGIVNQINPVSFVRGRIRSEINEIDT